MTEQIRTGSKKVRGMAQASRDLIEAMRAFAEKAQPITGRGIGYKLFTAGLIPSMETGEMAKVYRLLRIAREEGTIPWEWIVGETRSMEKVSTWDNPEQYARAVARSYRRDFWDQQPVRCEVWSEKGTVRGVLSPVLDEYAVGVRVRQGFSSAPTVHDAAQDDDGRDLIVLYVGDYDPSGMFMSEEDLPARLDKYEGYHIEITRIALTWGQTIGLPSFPASDKGPKNGKGGDPPIRTTRRPLPSTSVESGWRRAAGGDAEKRRADGGLFQPDTHRAIENVLGPRLPPFDGVWEHHFAG
jgi:hypothetical protein